MSELVKTTYKAVKDFNGKTHIVSRQLRVHDRGGRYEYWSIITFRDEVRTKINTGSREYINKLWGPQGLEPIGAQ